MKITLCGSARFEPSFVAANEALTLAGHVVFSLAVYPSAHGGEKEWYSDYEKTLLDLAHLAKIEESDAIVVVGDGYIGFSTAREIVWAVQRGKRVVRAFDPVDWSAVLRALVAGHDTALVHIAEQVLRDGRVWQRGGGTGRAHHVG